MSITELLEVLAQAIVQLIPHEFLQYGVQCLDGMFMKLQLDIQECNIGIATMVSQAN